MFELSQSCRSERWRHGDTKSSANVSSRLLESFRVTRPRVPIPLGRTLMRLLLSKSVVSFNHRTMASGSSCR